MDLDADNVAPNPEIHTDTRITRIPVLEENGQFGCIVVTLEPGEREAIELEGRIYIVIRDYIH